MARVTDDRDRRADDEALRELLDEVEALRLALGADLIIAAAAADDDRPDLASEVIDADRSELADFAARVERRLAGLGDRPIVVETPAPSVPRRVRAGTVLTAAALTGVLAIGAAAAAVHGPAPTSHPQAIDTAAVASSYDDFRRVVAAGASMDQVVAAADRLHHSLAQLIAAAATDPTSASRALRILHRETRTIQANQPNGAERILAAARALIAQLTGNLTAPHPKLSPPVVVIPILPTPSPSHSPKADRPRTKPTPPAQPTTAPKPQPTTSKQPQPSSSPTPSTGDPGWPFGPPNFGDHHL
jgi:hypothetical protein